MSNNNSQVVHIWAQQSGKDARNGKNNLYSRGRSLFSYRTEIARFIDGRAVYTSFRYSPTTSGKHLIHIPRALGDQESYRTARQLRDLPDTWQEIAPILFYDMLIDLKTEIESLRRARARIMWQVERIIESARAASIFYDNYIKDLSNNGAPRGFNYNEAITIADLDALNDPFTPAPVVLGKMLGIDLDAKIERDYQLQEIKEQRDRARIESARIERAKLQREKIAEWRSGAYNGTLYDLPIMLRIKDRIVETSHGARVPLDRAVDLMIALKIGVNLIGEKIGEFTVRSIDSEKIVIGCHSIPMTEIHSIIEPLSRPRGIN